MALDGWECSELSGPATLPCAPISASTGRPAWAAAADDITTTAAAPAEVGDAAPAVIVPSGRNAGRSLAGDSTVVPGRIPSSCVTVSGAPPRCGTVTPTISAANSPLPAAAAAR